tara:strand:- start:27213 stop:27593 length:381 start_codon:yes stop_codon:yes gene_type:complete
MRNLGVLHPTDYPAPPDTVTTILLAAGAAQAQDWLSSGSTALGSASSGGPQVLRLSGQTTAGLNLPFSVNLYSTAAASPTSGTSISSSGVSHPVMTPTIFQLPGQSTGFSVIALTSGYVFVEQWRK